MAFALRHPFDRHRWPRQLALHVTAALTYSVVHTAIMMGLRTVLLIGQELPAERVEAFCAELRTSFKEGREA